LRKWWTIQTVELEGRRSWVRAVAWRACRVATATPCPSEAFEEHAVTRAVRMVRVLSVVEVDAVSVWGRSTHLVSRERVLDVDEEGEPTDLGGRTWRTLRAR
jgi:hypothetical protein